MFDRRPAAPAVLEIGTEIVLARQNPEAVEVSGQDDFVETELIVGQGAEMGSSAGDDFRANIPAARHIPETHAAVQKVRRITRSQYVTAAVMFNTGGHVCIAEQFF